MREEISIGEVMERLKNELFPNPTNEFDQLCQQRELLIKEYLLIALNLVKQNFEYRSNYEGKIPHWKDGRIEEQVKNLCKYIELLALELDREKIIGHCQFKDKPMFNAFEPDYTFLMFNTVHGSILSDIMWSGDITVKDSIDISSGNLNIKELGRYLPTKIEWTKNTMLPYLKNSSKFKRHYETLAEVVKCADQGLIRACNLLLMTAIEGIVRDLASILNLKQNLNHDLSSAKFNSLDNLLRQGDWVEDYEIGMSEYEMLTRSKPPLVLNYSVPLDFKKLNIGLGFTTKINLKTRLDFLRRRFKEDRDLILHGQDSEYGSNWHLFVNFSALFEVHKTLIYYDRLYT